MYRLLQLILPLQMGLSAPLWWPSAGRIFPFCPIWDGFEGVPVWIVWLGSSLVVASAVARAAGWWSATNHALAGLILMAFLVVLDLNRLQVWVWMWGIFWIIDCLAGERSPAHAWVLAGVYAWGGFNKISPWFVDNFDWFCEAFALTRPLSGVVAAAYGAAVFEMLMGLLLLWAPARKWAVGGVLGLHVYILAVIGPFGHQWNAVVWPWNLAMMGWVWYFFIQHPPDLFQKNRANATAIVLTWILPLLHWWNAWPAALSWTMYANTQREATLRSETGLPCPTLQTIWERKAVYDRYLTIDDWAYEEIRVPAFNSLRNFERALDRVRRCAAVPPESIQLDILTVDRWKRQ